MPFTLSHAAAALPLNRRGLIFSALVIGSMAPDFAYFIPLPFNSDIGHTLPGIFLFDLPVGLLALWLFHAVLKNPLFWLLPESHQKRLIPYLRRFAFSGWARLRLVMLSLFIGVLTHLALDSFTHRGGLAVELLPALSAPVLTLAGTPVKLYSLLQYGLTVIGMALLALVYWRWYRRAPLFPLRPRVQLDDRARVKLALAMAAFAVVCGVGLALASMPPVDSLHRLRLLVSSVAVNTISMAGLELLVYGALWHMGKA